MNKDYDVIVIGSGPGGEGASIKASKSGLHVAIVEKGTQVGGGCTHTGTIPSKTLIYMVQQMVEANRNRFFLSLSKPIFFDFNSIMKHVRDVVVRQVRERQGYYIRNNIDVIKGTGRVVDKNSVMVESIAGEKRMLTAEIIVIATGSSPYRPGNIDFSNKSIIDSDKVLTLKKLPKRIAIYGAGVIGCEYASMFKHLGVKVTLLNRGKRILPFLDEELSEALSYKMREQGTLIYHNEIFDSVVIDGSNEVIVRLKSGKEIKSDIFFWAAGRIGNSAGLGLEKLGIPVTERGHIKVNKAFQTSVRNIYAVGDVIGSPGLSSTSYDQGLRAAINFTTGEVVPMSKFIPTGIFTIPEIGSVGFTEQSLTSAGISYEVGHAFFRNIARSHITGRTEGMLKILFDRKSFEILGVHCFGHNATELIHTFQAVMSAQSGKNNLKYFINNTLNYPTLAEIFRVAALNGLNRLI